MSKPNRTTQSFFGSFASFFQAKQDPAAQKKYSDAMRAFRENHQWTKSEDNEPGSSNNGPSA